MRESDQKWEEERGRENSLRMNSLARTPMRMANNSRRGMVYLEEAFRGLSRFLLKRRREREEGGEEEEEGDSARK
jgi:hypothetical protein